MAAHRYPILLFQAHAGLFTAVLVEDGGDIAGIGASDADAREQLRDYLEWNLKQRPWLAAPDFLDPSLTTLKVDVRPEYLTDKRPYPVSQTIPLRVPVVTGRTGAGLLVAAVPTLGIRFNFYDKDDLRPLVIQYVQAAMKGRTPAEVSRFLPPADTQLDDLVIHVPRESAAAPQVPDLEELRAVADPLGAREVRGRYSRAWGREALIDRLIDTLRREKAPVLLLGDSGVGKTSLLANAARRIERDARSLGLSTDTDEDSARAPRFWITSAPRLIAGMQYLGMWQERLEGVIAQLGSISAFLCAESLLDLVRTGGTSPTDSLAAFLIPYLARGEARFITEATPAEWDAIRRLLPALADLFIILTVPPMPRDKAIDCLSQIAAAQRQNLKIEPARGLVETVYRLFARFMPYHPFPGKAANFVIDLFDRAARDRQSTLAPADAIGLFTTRTGLPQLFLRDELPLSEQSVIDKLQSQVIGQPRACQAAAATVTTFKAGLNDPARPLGVMLFAGPTGTGKTQLALSLAEFLFGHEQLNTQLEDSRWKMEKSPAPSSILHPPSSSASPTRLLRLDMSEYSGPGAPERFLGTPLAPADWIVKLRQQPFTVLLLDEIEKADPEIFDTLLAVFDEGRLTDTWGRVTWFRSAVIIMTSNLGAASGAGFGLIPSAAPAYEGEVRSFFRPEFFNRIDAVVTFDPLSGETVKAIARKELADLAKREGFTARNLRLTWSDALVDHLAREGFDSHYGARPLQRTIEKEVVAPLARYLVENPTLRDRDIRLDFTNRLILRH